MKTMESNPGSVWNLNRADSSAIPLCFDIYNVLNLNINFNYSLRKYKCHLTMSICIYCTLVWKKVIFKIMKAFSIIRFHTHENPINNMRLFYYLKMSMVWINNFASLYLPLWKKSHKTVNFQSIGENFSLWHYQVFHKIPISKWFTSVKTSDFYVHQLMKYTYISTGPFRCA